MALTHSPLIVTNGLVLCLDAGNTKSYPGSGTTWTDLSGSGFNGTLTNGPTFSSTNGGSIVFDGTNDYATLSGNAFALGTNDFTVELWLYWTAIPSGDTIFIGGLSTGASQIGIQNFASNITLVKQGGATSVVFGSKNQLVINTWNNLVIRRSGTTHTCFINGTVDSSGDKTLSADWGTPTTCYIGAQDPGASNFLNGRISVARVYNRALSAAEIEQNFDTLRGRFGV